MKNKKEQNKKEGRLPVGTAVRVL
jgi:hypothetical protein